MKAAATVRCDVFCKVIDNFGDAGVCWRLARQLVSDQGWSVRLLIDRRDVLERIEPRLASGALTSCIDGVEVSVWPVEDDDRGCADVVIESFACHLPEHYLRAMTAHPRAPVWINLEYLSAEDWVESCHGLPSPDPRTGLVKFFFFPGFAERTGGIIHERRHADLARCFLDADQRLEFLCGLGVGEFLTSDFPVSVFCYPGSPLEALIENSPTIDARRPVWLIPDGVLSDLHRMKADRRADVRLIPFLPQDDYDRLLLSCDLNFVRGEDSFVRAQLAERPFVWQAYRQAENGHLDKIEAFLGRYLAEAPPVLAEATSKFWKSWNGAGVHPASTWPAFTNQLGVMKTHMRQWKKRLLQPGNLTENIAKFCESRL